jgi:hypothetical protein
MVWTRNGTRSGGAVAVAEVMEEAICWLSVVGLAIRRRVHGQFSGPGLVPVLALAWNSEVDPRIH